MKMQYKYYLCDVFTKKRFGGNPLAVLPEAEGLTDKQMQFQYLDALQMGPLRQV